MAAKIIFIAGTLPFILLGLLHTVYSALDTINPRRIVPRDYELIKSMQRTKLVITNETDVWRSWLGFNLSHGIGILFFGFVYFYMAVSSFEVLNSLTLLHYSAPLLAFVHVILAKLYWFRIPLIGAGIGCVLLGVGVLLS